MTAIEQAGAEAATATLTKIFSDRFAELSDDAITVGLDAKTSQYFLDRVAEEPGLRVALSDAAAFRAAKAARPPKGTPDKVYFIASVDGPIKIGTAVDPDSRLRGLQTASPARLNLLAVIDGGADIERGLHRRFAADRLSGEWFNPSSALLDFIASVIS